MKPYYIADEWKIIEEGFSANMQRSSESIFSIGNGRIGQRANFEEHYSGSTLQGNYIAGVYYPDKTRVGWWKNGYPEYFAKVLNAANWVGINIYVDGEMFDLATCKVSNFRRELNMYESALYRSFTAELPNGKIIEVNALRFLSLVQADLGPIKYSVKAVNFSGMVTFEPYIDFDVKNEDANYDEKFWSEISKKTTENRAFVTAATFKTDFNVCAGYTFTVAQNGEKLSPYQNLIERTKYASNRFSIDVKQGDTVEFIKYVAVASSLYYKKSTLQTQADQLVTNAAQTGFDALFAEHKAAWKAKWNEADITIEGDVEAQQAIRFNIFQLYQTYTGDDARLNIGPKGFTGEKYGGSTYWDTEAYCIPFYMSTADSQVARNLLKYRYNQLDRAIENAEKLGFKNGAALYPMVTMNGEECHNEWEITFEEIHRNGAIAYAIWNYVNYTNDSSYLNEFGIEVLTGIARFWAQRVHFSQQRNQYVMHGVTGPNEYENNVNNNFYTNYIATWCMKYAAEVVAKVKAETPDKYTAFVAKRNFRESEEIAKWTEISSNMYLPYNKKLDVFIQHDGFLDKEQIVAADLDPAERPINQHWSWDRILRSVFIKQADVLQGLFFFENEFDTETLRRNFDYYEPMTVHESSLSPCVHSILASKIGKHEKAYEMYLRTSRLDLDDYNKEVHEGLHITSMAGTWMSVVQGFGGFRVLNGIPTFSPNLPKKWQSLAFKLRFRESILAVKITAEKTTIVLEEGNEQKVNIFGEEYICSTEKTVSSNAYSEQLVAEIK